MAVPGVLVLPVASCAAVEIRASLVKAGTPIGPYHVLLAGQAVSGV